MATTLWSRVYTRMTRRHLGCPENTIRYTNGDQPTGNPIVTQVTALNHPTRKNLCLRNPVQTRRGTSVCPTEVIGMGQEYPSSQGHRAGKAVLNPGEAVLVKPREQDRILPVGMTPEEPKVSPPSSREKGTLPMENHR